MHASQNFDVAVLGGGLAGLSAALQLKQMRPATRIAVIEKREHPVTEVTYKVGESVAEIGAHYFKNVIGFERHMEQEQIRKFALRVFSPAQGNLDIARRPEIGLGRLSPLRTYQIDRGRIENALAAAVGETDVAFMGGSSVASVELGSDRHAITVKDGRGSRRLDARWVIDASGRAGILRRQLGLTIDIPHDVNAAWFRVPGRVAIDDWSDDAAWHARIRDGKRWMSTCHLVGEGYWVWLIPLPSGAHSVGVVADPRFVPFERIRRYEALLEWAHEAEPQLASKLPSTADGILDFRKVKNYAYGTRRGLSFQRWCLTGEAGLFLDPLYATGMDFIAIANTLATRLIAGALDDEPGFKRRLKAYNSYYLGQFLSWEPAFAGQYEVFRDAQATAAKVLWDNVSYFAYPVLMANHGGMLDPDFMPEARELFRPHHAMNVYMQRFFREWSRTPEDKRSVGFASGSDELMESLFSTAASDLSRAEIADAIHLNTERLRAMAFDMVGRMSEATATKFEPPPFERPSATWHEEIVRWSPYEQRTRPPAETEPQPASGWMLR
jgi:flavin-dependent dehydrogenase